MATLKESKFTSWELTDEEEIQASVLSSMNIILIQNDLNMAAEQAVNLEFTPEDTMKYLKQKSYLDAQIQTFEYLIRRSREAELLLKSLATKRS
jgi:hypothetical protein